MRPLLAAFATLLTLLSLLSGSPAHANRDPSCPSALLATLGQTYDLTTSVAGAKSAKVRGRQDYYRLTLNTVGCELGVTVEKLGSKQRFFLPEAIPQGQVTRVEVYPKTETRRFPFLGIEVDFPIENGATESLSFQVYFDYQAPHRSYGLWRQTGQTWEQQGAWGSLELAIRTRDSAFNAPLRTTACHVQRAKNRAGKMLARVFYCDKKYVLISDAKMARINEVMSYYPTSSSSDSIGMRLTGVSVSPRKEHAAILVRSHTSGVVSSPQFGNRSSRSVSQRDTTVFLTDGERVWPQE